MKTFKQLILAAFLTFSVGAAAFAQTATASKPAPNAASPKAETKPAPLPKADKIIDKFVKAIGGEAANKKLNSLYVKGSMEIPAAGIKGTFERFEKAPNKFAVFMKIPNFGEAAEIFDGSRAWSVDPIQGEREKSGEELTQTKLEGDFYRYISLKKLFPKRETKSLEKVDGADAYAVVLTAGDVVQTYYFDAKTGLLVRVDQIAVTPQGKVPAQTFLSDYRKVEGISLPFAMRLNAASTEIVFKTEEVKANIPIEDSKFVRAGK